MDDKTRELMNLLKELVIELSNAQITEIIGGAREEAFAEAKGIIKEMMVQAILECALTEDEGQKNQWGP